jgi:ABC-type transport system substrate-binding protein
MGTGPFIFADYTPGVEIRLARNPDYFKAGLPYLDEVVFQVIPEPSSQSIALEAGVAILVWPASTWPSTARPNGRLCSGHAGYS